MIQRLQTLYLLIVFILCVVSLFSTIGGYNMGGESIAVFSNFSFNTFDNAFNNVHAYGPWALGIVQIAVALISLYTILMFNKRILQMRLTTFNIILLCGYLVAYTFFAWIYQLKLEEVAPAGELKVSFQVRLTAIYPLVSVILCVLAFKGIRKDEKLVRSLERIR